MAKEIQKPETSGKVGGVSTFPKALWVNKPDPDRIHAGKAARAKLSPEEQKRLDCDLLRWMEENPLSSLKFRPMLWLLGHGADPDARESVSDRTTLMIAARHGDIEITELLIAHGADVHARCKHGVTALIYAAGNGAKLVVELLLANGADIDARDDSGHTALHSAIFLLDVGKRAGLNISEEDYLATIEFLKAHRATE